MCGEINDATNFDLLMILENWLDEQFKAEQTRTENNGLFIGKEIFSKEII